MTAVDQRVSTLSDLALRAIPERSGQGAARIQPLAGIAGMYQTAISRHLKDLEAAKMIDVSRGPTCPRRLRADALAESEDWLVQMQATVKENHKRPNIVLATRQQDERRGALISTTEVP